MNTQKKAIFSLAMIMILSIAVMQGITKKNIVTKDITTQQATLALGLVGSYSESQTVTGLAYGTGALTGNLTAAAIVNGWNPFGWGAAATAVVFGA